MSANQAAETSHPLARPGGVTLHYRMSRPAVSPQGAVVLLHGLSSNLTRWSEFVEHTHLRERFILLRPDLRGHGDSLTRRKISLERWSGDLLAILDAQGCRDAIVVGHSLGAHVALHFAAHHPRRARALVLIDPMLREAVRGYWRWLARLRLLLAGTAAAVRLLNRLGLHRRTIPPRDLRALDGRTRAQLAAADDPTAIVDHYSAPLADLRHFPTANYLQEFAELLRPLPLERVAAPVLTLLSREPTFTEPARTRATLARLAHGEIEEIDAFHWPLTERPAETRTAIERFCERVTQA
jgi:pimeloyl-ACP methyl ester carboxylesterase